MRRTSGSFLSIAASLCALAAIAGCGRARREAQAVVLVTFDTTRANHVGCYGYASIETPALDGVAKAGVLFRQATAAAPITLPSHTSMMTGRYPAAHGVRNNGMFVLPESERTLAEVFKAHGYETAAFIGGFPLSSQFGLKQGFDTYDEKFDTPEEGPVDKDVVQRNAAKVNEAALPWIAARKGKKFFLWIHYYDPHAPYNPPSPFSERYEGNLYDGEIAFADSQLAVILSCLAEAADPGRTVLAVLGDHGESLGEHGETFHGVLIYEPATRTPFLLRASGRLPAGAEIAEPVSDVDVFPTLLDLAGLEKEIRKDPPIQGVDLVPLATGRAASARPAGSAGKDSAPVLSESLLSNLEFGWSELHAIRSGNWKYVEAPRPELYDLGADPGEQRNLLAEAGSTGAVREGASTGGVAPAGGSATGAAPAANGARSEVAQRAATLRASLDATISRLESSRTSASARQQMDPETIEKLQSLGYLQGPAGAAPAPAGGAGAARKDPKDLIGLYQRIVDVGATFRQARYDEVIETCRSLLAEDPDSPRLHRLLGESLLALKRYAEAEKVLGPLVSMNDTSHDWVAGLLARVKEGQEDKQGALALYRIAMARDPDLAANALRAAKLLYEMGKYGESLEQAQKILAKNPRHVPALELSADDQRRLGDVEAAIDLWRRALQESPDDRTALATLGPLLFAKQRFPEAQQVFERLSRVAPDSVESHRFLGALAVLRGKNDEAVPLLRRASELMPDDPMTRYWLGIAFIKTRNLSGAEAEILPLVQKHPDLLEGHRVLGMLRKEQGRREEAIASFRRALQIKPDDSLSRQSLLDLGATP